MWLMSLVKGKRLQLKDKILKDLDTLQYVIVSQVWFGWFDGISTLIGYLMLDPSYTYIWFAKT